VNFSKIKNQLTGFHADWNVKRGAKELYDACREAELKLEDFDGPRFKRIVQIRKLLAARLLDPQLRWTDAVAAGASSVSVRQWSAN
jgi:hypothetical protein